MAKPLIIVESPTKAKTIKKFLPARFVVKASVGHVRDLPKSTLGVDVLNGFTPRYLTIKGKGDIIKDLKAAAKGASEVYLATDPDREGEAIAWHLAELLKLENPKRIELHEITKDAALAALKDAHAIDMPRVNAQQARRILDRLVGYKISPLLWAKVRGGLSAGRVQSVAVRLIVDREREIRAFLPREYWTVTAQLAQLVHDLDAPAPMVFPADLLQIDGAKAEITNGEQAEAIMAALQGAAFRIDSVKTRETRRNAAAPFTTSTLQQEASRKLKFRVRKTMQLAQALYEGVDLGRSEGTQGLITYMRTDSTRISDSARDAAREYITGRFGAEYHSGGRQFKLKEGAQDAHEAIRPTSVLHTPESLSKILKRDELRLYQLIWERFVASQMAPAVFDQTTVDIAAAQRFTFRATGSVLKFAGFTAVYEEGTDDAAQPEGGTTAKGTKRPILPKLTANEDLDAKSIDPKQHFTEPPPRFTEASLVRTLEENGIGRPSTYSAIVETIQARGYVEQLERRFYPTDIGEQVNDLLEKHFPDIVDPKFTALMEGQLDTLADTGGDWDATAKVLGAFYVDFEKELAEAERVLPKFEQRDEPTDEICVNCGKPMVIKTGRFGKFMSCTGYPECKTTKPILKDTGVKCPKDGGMIAERKSRKGRTFYGCANYPACDFVSWDPVAPQPCAVCGDYVVEKRKRGGGVSYVCHTDRTHATGLGAHPDSDEADAELEPV
ncbi:MAG TPA: type I DNA topoisomerase [Candidatus Elarobacter sp.]|nr:type I DNA topoisomerase [Candidatus Elarobacter sp.]HEV2737146.1 type I DNA topoisomerase [Candidatus Elarobacter sp.]